MRDFNSPFSWSWRLISAWAFLNWAFVFPSFFFKIDTSSSNRAVSSWACNKWNRNDSLQSCDSVFTISAVSRETVSFASDVMSLLTVNDSSVNDSSTRRLLFFVENLADGGGLFRGEECHANFEGTAVMHVYTHLPSCKAFSDFAFTKMQYANVCSFRLNFVLTSLRIFCSHWARRFGSFGKLKKPIDSLSVGVYGCSLVVKRNTAIIFELELIPNKISSRETVALKKSLLDER